MDAENGGPRLRLHREQLEAILAALTREGGEHVELSNGSDGRLLTKMVETKETLRPLSLTTRRQRVEAAEAVST